MAQSAKTLRLILSAVQHIVLNLLNNFQLIRLDIEDIGTVKKESLAMLDKGVEETVDQLRQLEKIKEPEKLESYKNIFPK